MACLGGVASVGLLIVDELGRRNLRPLTGDPTRGEIGLLASLSANGMTKFTTV
jgi:hypothetical protein